MIRRVGWAFVAVVLTLGIIGDIQRIDDQLEAGQARALAQMQRGGAN